MIRLTVVGFSDGFLLKVLHMLQTPDCFVTLPLVMTSIGVVIEALHFVQNKLHEAISRGHEAML